jgi:homoserine dehydrogenase
MGVMILTTDKGATSKEKTVPVIFLGFGLVGQALLRQIVNNHEALVRRAGLRVVPVGLADLSGALIDAGGISQEGLRSALQAGADGQLLEEVSGTGPLEQVDDLMRAGSLLVDLTASGETGKSIRRSLDAGCGVILANKIPLSNPWSEAETLFREGFLRYEVTVGAGLPVIKTLRYLLDTGDQITGIEGCLSGTLGFLSDSLMQELLFSEALANARTQGYTEPDPRIDLSGKDVARKILILARTAGWPLEIEDLSVEALYPESMKQSSVDEFMASANALDDEFSQRAQRAVGEGKVLRYVARVNPEGGEVGLAAVPKDSALGTLRGPENYIAIHSERYREVPLVLSGPGAGPEVTAAGVLGDIISLSKQLVVEKA